MRFLVAGAAAAAVAATVMVAACGTAPAPVSASPKVNLSFRISAGTGQAARHGTLRCEPAGGSVPDAATACRTLLAMKHSPFAPVPRRRICPMIMVSDGRIVLTGNWFGKPVHRVVADGGCDLMLFSVLARILR